MLFYAIVLLTLLNTDDLAWYDILAGLWIISYMLENFRTIHRLYRYSGASDHCRTGTAGVWSKSFQACTR